MFLLLLAALFAAFVALATSFPIIRDCLTEFPARFPLIAADAPAGRNGTAVAVTS